MPTRKKAEAKTNGKGEATDKLDAVGLDQIEEWLLDGKGYRWIAQQAGVSIGSVAAWIAKDAERSARCAGARQESADGEDEQALQELMDIPDDATPAQIARARELASHRRWRAKTRNPFKYGDKQTIDMTVSYADLSDEELTAKAAALLTRIQG